MKNLYDKLKGRPLGELISVITKNIVQPISLFSSANRSAKLKDLEFDNQWGTETSGTENLGSLDVELQHARHGVRYQASDHTLIERLITDLQIDLTQFTFIDFGSGKGRITLAVSRLPFRKVLGIEFSAKLVEIARANLTIFQQKADVRASVEFRHENVLDVSLPPGDLVCYFYNPFDETIMQQVVRKLEGVSSQSGACIVVIYIDPRCAHLFSDKHKWCSLEQLSENEDVLVVATPSYMK